MRQGMYTGGRASEEAGLTPSSSTLTKDMKSIYAALLLMGGSDVDPVPEADHHDDDGEDDDRRAERAATGSQERCRNHPTARSSGGQADSGPALGG